MLDLEEETEDPLVFAGTGTTVTLALSKIVLELDDSAVVSDKELLVDPAATVRLVYN